MRLVGRMSANVNLARLGRHRKAQALPLPRVVRGQTGDPRGFRKVVEKKKKTSKKEWKW